MTEPTAAIETVKAAGQYAPLPASNVIPFVRPKQPEPAAPVHSVSGMTARDWEDIALEVIASAGIAPSRRAIENIAGALELISDITDGINRKKIEAQNEAIRSLNAHLDAWKQRNLERTVLDVVTAITTGAPSPEAGTELLGLLRGKIDGQIAPTLIASSEKHMLSSMAVRLLFDQGLSVPEVGSRLLSNPVDPAGMLGRA